jgi:hypothetical protein
MALNAQQLQELAIAARRRTPEDIRNLEFAKRTYGYREPTPTPTPPTGSVPIPGAQYNTRESQQASFSNIQPIGNTLYGVPKTAPIIRTEDAGIATKIDPLEQWKNNTQFLESAKDIIRKKQKMNEDIQGAKQYWNTVYRDTSSFGTPNVNQVPGAFTDESYRQMSPEQQAGVRASRMSAAQAHLEGLGTEERFRDVASQDTIKFIEDMITEKDKLAQSEIDKTYKMLQIAKARQELGVTPTADDLGLDSTKGIGTRIGGSVSWRHNNPGNIKFGDFAKKYGAIQGQAATDGGYFAVFPDLETGQRAMADLLKSNSYKNLTLEQAMRRWSGNGYGADVIGWGKNTLMSMFTSPDAMKELTTAMIKREGWKEGQTLSTSTTHKFWTEAQIRSLAVDTGKTFAELNAMTDDQLTQTIRQTAPTLVDDALKSIPSTNFIKLGITQDMAKDILTAMFENPNNPDLVKKAMEQNRIDAGIYDQLKAMINKTYLTSIGG